MYTLLHVYDALIPVILLIHGTKYKTYIASQLEFDMLSIFKNKVISIWFTMPPATHGYSASRYRYRYVLGAKTAIRTSKSVSFVLPCDHTEYVLGANQQLATVPLQIDLQNSDSVWILSGNQFLFPCEFYPAISMGAFGRGEQVGISLD
jgi:hypothetical protein